MLKWLIEHTSLVASLATLLTAVVWTFYAVLFFREFARQRRPFFVIHQARGSGLDALCLLVNLSKEPVHVLCVLAVLHTRRGTLAHRVQGFRSVARGAETGQDLRTSIKQGPLASGAYLDLGSFEAMLDAAAAELQRNDNGDVAPGDPMDAYDIAREVQQLEIRVVALHSAHESPVGAWRSFGVYARGDEVAIEPAMLLTRQMASRAEARTVRAWLRECMPGAGPSGP